MNTEERLLVIMASTCLENIISELPLINISSLLESVCPIHHIMNWELRYFITSILHPAPFLSTRLLDADFTRPYTLYSFYQRSQVNYYGTCEKMKRNGGVQRNCSTQ